MIKPFFDRRAEKRSISGAKTRLLQASISESGKIRW